jgi:hypothetical protein
MHRDWTPRFAVAFGYLCVAIAFSWPLPLYLGTAVTGDPGGDTGVYIWNQWVFQHELLVERANPLRTDHILSTTERVDLSQHNYTVFLNLIALPLIPLLGVVTAFNLVLLIVTVITALCTYALARRVTSATRVEAWLAGLAFAWCPALVARSVSHFSLVAAAPLAAFILCLVTADRTRRARDAALAGLCLAWAGFSDPYYAVYCLLIAIGYIAARVVPISFSSAAASPAPLRWALNIAIVSVAGLVIGLLVGPGGRFDILGIPISVRGLYTPVFLLTALLVARLLVEVRPHLSGASAQWSPAAMRAIVIGGLACVGPLSPVLYGLGERIVDGRFVAPPTLWRSSPRGVDLLGLFECNPNHVLARAFKDHQLTEGVFVEYTAALSLVALAVVGVAVWRGGYRPRAGWVVLTVGFAALSLGPFIHVAGANTYIPGPWAVLRYVPLIDAARTPTRFSIVAALGLAIMLAGALAALGRRFPKHRRLVAATVGVLLVLELVPAPRTLHSAAMPSVYQTIAADPRPVRVLQLPFGVRDGTFAVGDFSARYLFYQTGHGKQLIGGYLSRISPKRVQEVRAQPTLDALVIMSEGGTLTPPHAAWIRSRGPTFIERANVGYVVVDETRTPAQLVDFVIDAWALEEIGRDGALALYRPRSRTGPAFDR